MERQDGVGGDPLEMATGRIIATLEGAGIYVGLEVDGDTLVLTGEVDSDANRQAALDVARAATSGLGVRLVDAIEVMETSPDSAFDRAALPLADEPWTAGVAGAPADPSQSMAELDADFTDDLGTTDPQVAVAEGIPYYPPTDPVVRPRDDSEALEVLSGFGPGAPEGGGDEPPTDDELVERVADALRRDALTSDLVIRVAVRDGVVWLRGEVPAVDDAANAEAIAGDVPGVVEVREDLRVRGA